MWIWLFFLMTLKHWKVWKIEALWWHQVWTAANIWKAAVNVVCMAGQSTTACGRYMSQFSLHPHGTGVKSLPNKVPSRTFFAPTPLPTFPSEAIGAGRGALRKAPEGIASCKPLNSPPPRPPLQTHGGSQMTHFKPEQSLSPTGLVSHFVLIFKTYWEHI